MKFKVKTDPSVKWFLPISAASVYPFQRQDSSHAGRLIGIDVSLLNLLPNQTGLDGRIQDQTRGAAFEGDMPINVAGLDLSLGGEQTQNRCLLVLENRYETCPGLQLGSILNLSKFSK